MNRIARHTIRAVLLGACILTATASVAWAADYPPTQNHGSLNLPNGANVAANGSVAIAGTDCGASQSVTVAFDGTTVKTVTTDASGAFSTSVAVPAGTEPGTHTVTASNASCSLTANVTVTAAGSDPSTGTLPRTGSSSTMPTALVAIGAVLLGATLVVVTRRRMRRYAVTSKDA